MEAIGIAGQAARQGDLLAVGPQHAGGFDDAFIVAT